MAKESDTNDVNDIVVCKINKGYIVCKWEEKWEDTISLKIIGIRQEEMEVEEEVVKSTTSAPGVNISMGTNVTGTGGSMRQRLWRQRALTVWGFASWLDKP